jgi:hypothetical protein
LATRGNRGLVAESECCRRTPGQTAVSADDADREKPALHCCVVAIAGIVERDSRPLARIGEGDHRLPSVAAVLADIGGIIELAAVEAGCAGNDVARVTGIYRDRRLVASV